MFYSACIEVCREIGRVFGVYTVQLPTSSTTADTADVQQNTSILNAQVVSRDPGVFVNNCVSKGREDMVSMGCVRGWGIGYIEVQYILQQVHT